MKLTSCPRCERHVVIDASSCPFCGTRLGTTHALERAFMVAVLGLALSSCNNDEGTDGLDLGGADYTGPGPVTASSGGPEPGTSSSGSGTASGTSSSSSTSSSSTTGPADGTASSTSGTSSDGGGADYTGPGPGGTTTGTSSG